MAGYKTWTRASKLDCGLNAANRLQSYLGCQRFLFFSVAKLRSRMLPRRSPSQLRYEKTLWHPGYYSPWPVVKQTLFCVRSNFMSTQQLRLKMLFQEFLVYPPMLERITVLFIVFVSERSSHYKPQFLYLWKWLPYSNSPYDYPRKPVL